MQRLDGRSPVRRVAALGDVHGNAVALAAVLADLAGREVDGVVWLGDLSWGSEPEATLELVRSVALPARFVRGNAERALAELRAGSRPDTTERERWLLERHDEAALELAASYEEQATLQLAGLGPTRFCHGSPRGDTECITVATPAERIAEATRGTSERTLVTGHTHMQFDREVAGVRSLNPGSVGLPYEGTSGAAYWAILGPEVELRSTAYDVDEAVAGIRASGDPGAEQTVELLLRPPPAAEAVEHAERLRFSD